jgi:hypothetical protein
MKQLLSYIPLAAAPMVIAVLLSFFPAGARAAELLVPKGFATIQAAITAAAAGDTIVVDPGTYQEAITLKSDVTIRGRETARTLLGGGSGGPIVVVNGPISAAIRNITFLNASTGIRVTDNASKLSITNNVFQVGPTGVAIDIQNSAQTEVVNNVFYQNGTAVSRDADTKIVNNIFMLNSTAISGAGGVAANISNNAFFENITGGPTGANPVLDDPIFVDPANHDFHLQDGSPCINAGDTSAGLDFDNTQNDIGAYGGPSADPTPFPVAGLKITEATDATISLAWLANTSYLVTNGGYRLYYGYASGSYNGTDADGGISPSPIDVGNDVSTTLVDLNLPLNAPPAPVLDQPSFRDAGLNLTWSASDDATGYKIHYGQSSTAEHSIDVGNTTSYALLGLTNGQKYRVAVSAYAAPRYFFAITVFDSTPEAHESAFSPEVSTRESALSNEQVESPDPVQAYPALPNGRHSCFIATAAYGSYSAPEVVALRAFRDRYLLSNEPGRRFVEWYYRRGPAAAALLNAHPAWKRVVRTALMPVVGAAIFMTETSTLTKAAAVFVIISASVFGFRRKRLSSAGELR